MSERWLSERRQVLEAAKELERLGLVAVSSGNVSIRVDDGGRPLLIITPMGLPYARMTAGDVVVADFEGEPVEGERPPSSELNLHVAVYQARPDARAVVHTHSISASVCAVGGLEIPPIVDEMVVNLGGGVRVAEYGFPSTRDLGDKAVAALGDRKAVLLRNHGLAVVGATLEEALAHCRLVERLAQIFLTARALGVVHPLSPDVVETERAIYLMRLRVQQEQ